MSYLDSIISDISYMSILFEQKYKIFLIYFSGTKWQNRAVHICTVSDTPSTPPPLRSARRGLSGIECRPVQRVQRLGGGMPWYLSALVLARPALLPVMCRPSGCAGALGSPPAGYIAATQPRPVSSAKNLQNKKGVSPSYHPLFSAQNTPTPIANLKNSAAKTKRPLQRVCVLCYTCLTSLEREESVK